jgi:hypothetical protein
MCPLAQLINLLTMCKVQVLHVSAIMVRFLAGGRLMLNETCAIFISNLNEKERHILIMNLSFMNNYNTSIIAAILVMLSLLNFIKMYTY